jgi:hypothetical protein
VPIPCSRWPAREATARWLDVQDVRMPNRRLGFVLLMAGATAACGQTIACHAIGCSSGASVDLTAMPLQPGPLSSVTICIDKQCSTQRPATLPLEAAEATSTMSGVRTVKVSIHLVGPDGRVLADDAVTTHVQRVHPNGRECGPVCYDTALRLTSAGRLAP